MKKLHKMMKAFAVCVALALVFCMIPVGSVYATEAGTEQTVTVTIDNTNSHFAVRLYPDANNIDEEVFEVIMPGKTSTPINVKEGTTVRMRIYIQGDGYLVPDNYSIEGATKVINDSKVNFGWCRAAFNMTVNADTVIKIPDGVVCNHPDVDPSVRWGYYDCGYGKHELRCTLCSMVMPETIGAHTLKEMTPAEYVEWYYNDGNFNGMSEQEKAENKAKLSQYWCGELGITADTKARFCTLCEYGEKIADADNSGSGNNSSTDSSSTSSSQPAEAPAPAPTPTPTPAPTPAPAAEVPAAQPVAAGLADASGVLPEGATIAAATVTSGAAYEKAVEVIKAQVSGLGEYSVMEINLTDAANTQVHQLNGYVQVSVPMPANITVKEGKAIVVYRLEDDGTLTRCDTTVENGVITFKTNHFSTYIVAEEDVTAVTSPKTEDVSAGINLIFCMGILLAGAAAVAVKRKMA